MTAVVFPGQGSQRPGMGRELEASNASASELFGRVSEATGIDVRALCFESKEETLRQTENAQLALFTCGVAAWTALVERVPGLQPLFAGHSVGEYAALAAAGIVSVEDGARLVRRRGELMAQSGSLRPGTMAAVLGLDRADLEEACAKVSDEREVAVVANDNCPGQLVISGDPDAVRRASQAAVSMGAKRVLPLNVSGAFHSRLMEDCAAAMGESLRRVEFHSGGTVFANVTAAPVADPAQWPELLERQLTSPVRWTETVRALRSAGVATMVECGAGEVLCGLARRIDSEIRSERVDSPETLEAAAEALGGGTAGGSE